MSTEHYRGKSPRESEGERQEKGFGRRPWSAAGRIFVHDDFDDPLPEEMLTAYVVGREAGCDTGGDNGGKA